MLTEAVLFLDVLIVAILVLNITSIRQYPKLQVSAVAKCFPSIEAHI